MTTIEVTSKADTDFTNSGTESFKAVQIISVAVREGVGQQFSIIIYHTIKIIYEALL